MRPEGLPKAPNPRLPWHTLNLEETYAALGSGPRGLDAEEAIRRLAEYGPNEVERAKRVSWPAILLAQLANPLVFVLIVAAAVSIAAGKSIDAMVIGVVIIINTLIGFTQEYRAEEALESLKAQAAPEAEVIRVAGETGEGIDASIPTAEIVPGDVVLLEAGSRVPADARLVEAANLDVEEAMLTGESLPARKSTAPLDDPDLPASDRRNLVYGGTVVTNGRGRAIVYATGAHTEMGKIATLIGQTEKLRSPLQEQTLDLGKKLGLLAVGVASITIILGLLLSIPLHEIFLFALASVVSSIPEGLPAVMSITLAVGVNRMARRKAIIRRLPAVDTLGCATVICTDKTGTLTSNQMTVQEMVLGGRQLRVSGVGFAPQGDFSADGTAIDPAADSELSLALTIGALCNDSRLVKDRHDGAGSWRIRGDPTEGALVVAAAKAGLERETLTADLPRLDELPFSSETRFMATFHRAPDGQALVFIKGAPDTVLRLCSHNHLDGESRPLDDAERERILAQNNRMASGALRVLGLAHQTIAAGDVSAYKDALENGDPIQLTFAGLVGMMDPPRPEVPEAVARCRSAGVRVMMITGDHMVTGEAIARQVGILVGDERVLGGPELEHMDDGELDAVIEDTAVFARVSPEHKHRIVESLQRQGHVVAMTGDGVNDAPALQAAQIGVAMGITGTDVTIETAEMVLTDDNFASIVNAVEEGRVIFQNVRKVVKFLLATNIGEDLTLLASLVLFASKGLIFTPVQILWVNLVTDGVLDIALAMEPKEGDIMDQPPRASNERIINMEIMRNTVFVALFMAAGTLLMFSQADAAGDLRRAQTIAFTTLAAFQIFNSLNCRSRQKSVFQLGLLRNRYLVGAIALSVVLQLAALHLPFMQTALGTVGLGLKDWGLIVLVSASIFVADELRKLVQRRSRA